MDKLSQETRRQLIEQKKKVDDGKEKLDVAKTELERAQTLVRIAETKVHDALTVLDVREKEFCRLMTEAFDQVFEFDFELKEKKSSKGNDSLSAKEQASEKHRHLDS